jgi:nicotinamide mononucleotide transporter
MNQVFNELFDQYSTYNSFDIILEIIAVFFGFLSVWFSKKNKIWVFPTGMISTSIFVYLLFKMGSLRRHDDQWVLFYHECLWLVCMDS